MTNLPTDSSHHTWYCSTNEIDSIVTINLKKVTEHSSLKSSIDNSFNEIDKIHSLFSYFMKSFGSLEFTIKTKHEKCIETEEIIVEKYNLIDRTFSTNLIRLLKKKSKHYNSKQSLLVHLVLNCSGLIYTSETQYDEQKPIWHPTSDNTTNCPPMFVIEYYYSMKPDNKEIDEIELKLDIFSDIWFWKNYNEEPTPLNSKYNGLRLRNVITNLIEDYHYVNELDDTYSYYIDEYGPIINMKDIE